MNHDELRPETIADSDPVDRPPAEATARKPSPDGEPGNISPSGPDSPPTENAGGTLERTQASLSYYRQRWQEISGNISRQMDSWERELAEARTVIQADLRPLTSRCRRLLRLMRVFSIRKHTVRRSGVENDVQSHR